MRAGRAASMSVHLSGAHNMVTEQPFAGAQECLSDSIAGMTMCTTRPMNRVRNPVLTPGVSGYHCRCDVLGAVWRKQSCYEASDYAMKVVNDHA
jgi:hypothetical protein